MRDKIRITNTSENENLGCSDYKDGVCLSTGKTCDFCGNYIGEENENER